jgi:hypothetical protein
MVACRGPNYDLALRTPQQIRDLTHRCDASLGECVEIRSIAPPPYDDEHYYDLCIFVEFDRYAISGAV